MSRFAHENPEDYEAAWDRLVDCADLERKAARENGPAMLRWTVEWYSGGSEVVEAADFDAAVKSATRIAKRRFLKIAALYRNAAA